ncbi:MAG: WD40 repeat domain-containing protein, partial [Planctomycetota bacterium]
MNSEPTPPQQPDTEAPEEQPEVYAIRKHGSRWDVTRRHVVTGSALAAATSLVGCSDNSPSSSPSPNYSASLLPPIAHTEDILVIKATPNGDLLLSGGQDKTVKFWSLPKGHLVRSLMGHQHPITHIAISPNGALAATADSGPKIILWSIPEGRRQRQLKSVTLAPNDLCISDQGEVAIRKNLTLMFWPTAETELEPQQRTLPASPTVHLFAPHTSGLWSVAACQSNTLYLTNLTQSSLVHTLTGI